MTHSEAGSLGGRGNKATSDRNSFSYGETTGYLKRRLKADHPDILAAYERGDYPSVRQAAIAAGIVKVLTPLDLLNRAWAKASEEERQAFWAAKAEPS